MTAACYAEGVTIRTSGPLGHWRIDEEIRTRDGGHGVGDGRIGFSALADDHDNHGYVRHDDWKKGAKIHDEDWNRGEHIDYKERHLRAPPHGYEWRQVDGNYVLAAVATGVIASVVVAAAEH